MKTKTELLAYWLDLHDHVLVLSERYLTLKASQDIGLDLTYMTTSSWAGLEAAVRLGLVTADEQEDVTALTIHLGMCALATYRIKKIMRGYHAFLWALESASEDLEGLDPFIPKAAAFIHDVSATFEGLIHLMPHMTRIPKGTE